MSNSVPYFFGHSVPHHWYSHKYHLHHCFLQSIFARRPSNNSKSFRNTMLPLFTHIWYGPWPRPCTLPYIIYMFSHHQWHSLHILHRSTHATIDTRWSVSFISSIFLCTNRIRNQKYVFFLFSFFFFRQHCDYRGHVSALPPRRPRDLPTLSANHGKGCHGIPPVFKWLSRTLGLSRWTSWQASWTSTTCSMPEVPAQLQAICRWWAPQNTRQGHQSPQLMNGQQKKSTSFEGAVDVVYGLKLGSWSYWDGKHFTLYWYATAFLGHLGMVYLESWGGFGHWKKRCYFVIGSCLSSLSSWYPCNQAHCLSW